MGKIKPGPYQTPQPSVGNIDLVECIVAEGSWQPGEQIYYNWDKMVKGSQKSGKPLTWKLVKQGKTTCRKPKPKTVTQIIPLNTVTEDDVVLSASAAKDIIQKAVLDSAHTGKKTTGKPNHTTKYLLQKIEDKPGSGSLHTVGDRMWHNVNPTNSTEEWTKYWVLVRTWEPEVKAKAKIGMFNT